MTSHARHRQYIDSAISEAKQALSYGHNFGFVGYETELERSTLCKSLRTLILSCSDVIKEVEHMPKPKPKGRSRWSTIGQ